MSKLRHAARIGHLDLDLLVVEFAATQLLAEDLTGGLRCIGANQRFDDAGFGIELGLGLDVLALAALDHGDAGFDQVADDLVDVAADIADLGELGRFHLDEGRIGKLGQAPRDLGLAHAGGSDHQDVLRHHLVAHGAGELLAPPAVAQGDGDGALGLGLTDDVAVEFRDDLAGREVGHGGDPLSLSACCMMSTSS